MALTRILSGASSSANPFGQCFDRRLGGRVEQGSWRRMGADDGAEIDDTPALGAETLDRLLHHENRPKHVDVVMKVKALLGDLGERAEAEDPSVVNQNIQ